MKKEMLINVLQPEECRIAIVEDGVLEELYVERTSQESYVGNIYKGRIVNIEPSIQAAFVDFGIGRNGFLHVSDVEPTYYRHLEQGRGGGRDRDRGDRDRDRDRGERRGNGHGMGRDRDRDRPPEGERLPRYAEEASEELGAFGGFLEAEPLAPPPEAAPGDETSFGAGVLDEDEPAAPPAESAPPAAEAGPPLV